MRTVPVIKVKRTSGGGETPATQGRTTQGRWQRGGVDSTRGRLRCRVPLLFFFFQAEDGIRDVAVTGVQTCALPISSALAVKPVEGVSVAAGPGAPAPEAPAPQPVGILWCVEAWFLGVLLLSLRTAGGLFLVEKMRRCEMRPVARELYEKCLALQRKMGLERVIRYCECLRLDAPAVLGWVRPVVLLPAKALTGLSEEQIAMIIAHELAHIRRLDGFVNLFQIGVETLLFYHPAVK